TFQDLAVRLPELLLMRVDKMTMLNSVEARAPFLDHRLVELAFTLSGRAKLEGDVTKRLVKEAAAPWLPHELIYRKKVGFDVPLAKWLRQEPLASWAARSVLDSSFMRRDLLEPEVVRRMFADHQEGRIDAGIRIWNLVNVCA